MFLLVKFSIRDMILFSGYFFENIRNLIYTCDRKGWVENIHKQIHDIQKKLCEAILNTKMFFDTIKDSERERVGLQGDTKSKSLLQKLFCKL